MHFENDQSPFEFQLACSLTACTTEQGRRAGLVVMASDSGARGRGFDPHSGHHVVSLSKTHLPLKSNGNAQEAGLRPNTTEKLFTGTLRIKSTYQQQSNMV